MNSEHFSDIYRVLKQVHEYLMHNKLQVITNIENAKKYEEMEERLKKFQK
jgi:uncharacterized protein YqgV (UPF0045/DUF77 family)